MKDAIIPNQHNRNIKMTTTATATAPTPDEIWAILREVSANLEETAAIGKETAASQKETDRLLKKTAAAQEKGIQEMAEFRASQRARQKEADARRKEVDAKQAADHEKLMQEMKETSKQIKKTEALFNTQWGQLMESLVDGDLVPLLNRRGIPVEHTVTNAKKRGRDDNYEYDIIAVNGEEIVVVEVKTTLRVQDVRDFLESLGKVATRMPHYKHKIIYGAMAWLRVDSRADVYAERQGLFVIRATGSSASILNKEDFKPQVFS